MNVKFLIAVLVFGMVLLAGCAQKEAVKEYTLEDDSAAKSTKTAAAPLAEAAANGTGEKITSAEEAETVEKEVLESVKEVQKNLEELDTSLE